MNQEIGGCRGAKLAVEWTYGFVLINGVALYCKPMGATWYMAILGVIYGPSLMAMGGRPLAVPMTKVGHGLVVAVLPTDWSRGPLGCLPTSHSKSQRLDCLLTWLVSKTGLADWCNQGVYASSHVLEVNQSDHSPVGSTTAQLLSCINSWRLALCRTFSESM